LARLCPARRKGGLKVICSAATAVDARSAATPEPRAAAAGADVKVAYLVSRFPKLTETFVLYEILALEGEGVPVEIYPLLSVGNAATRQGASLGRKFLELFKRGGGRPAVIHPDAVPLVERAHYHPLFSLAVVGALLSMMVTRPRACFSALATLVRATWGSAGFLLGGLAIFPKCAWIARQMERDGVTHIHAHFANHPAAAAFLIHRLTGIPYSFTAHGSDLHMDRHMLREKVREAARVVTISHYNRNLILEECGAEHADKVEVIHCGVDTRVFRGATGRETAGRPLQILCIGTMHEVKGQTYLLEACRLLAQRGLDFTCHLVGHGPDAEALKEQTRAAGLESRVVFHGLLTREQVADLVGRCDVLACPSVPTSCGRREGIPVVLMEAMASELPVVASAISGIPELVDDGENGCLVQPRDAGALADALALLHGNADLRRRFGQSGRRKVTQEFDVHRNAGALAERFRGSPAGRPIR